MKVRLTYSQFGPSRLFWALRVPLLSLLALLLLPSLPAQAAQAPGWQEFQDGKSLFEQRRLGESLNAMKRAIDLRRARYIKASEGIETAMASAEAAKAKNSISQFLAILARQSLSEREASALRSEAGGSLRRQAELYKARIPPKLFSDFLDGLLAVLDLRSADSLRDSLAELLLSSRSLEGYPEAEYWIGRIFLTEGELNLAELQFERSLSLADGLEIPEDRYAILEARSAVFKAAGKWKEYELSLSDSLEGSTIFGDKNAFLREAMERALTIQGFDSLVSLYQVTEYRILKPSADLGEYLLRRGRSQAVMHLAIAADGYVTRGIARIRERDPGYSYVDLGGFAARLRLDPELLGWADDQGLWKILYYLGEALLEQSERASARSLFEALARINEAGPWARASRLALSRPMDAAFILP